MSLSANSQTAYYLCGTAIIEATCRLLVTFMYVRYVCPYYLATSQYLKQIFNIGYATRDYEGSPRI